MVRQVLERSRSSGSARLLLMAIAQHADDAGHAWPSVTLLATRTKLAEGTIYRLRRQLIQSGELVITRPGGPRRSTRYQVIPGGAEQLVIHEVVHVTGSLSTGEVTTGEGRGLNVGGQTSQPERSGVTSRRDESSLNPQLNGQGLPRASARDGLPTELATTKQITREQHAFGREAEEVWREAAAKVESPYLTRGHVRQVHELAIDATRWATEAQILAAIRRRLDAASAPVRIPEWARLEAADDFEREHQQRRSTERAERNHIVEHEGTLWLGHVPMMSGEICVRDVSTGRCGRAWGDHKLAEAPRLAPLGNALAVVVDDARARVVS